VRPPVTRMRPCHENGLPCLGGVRLVDVVAEPAFVVLGAGVAVLLHGPRAPDEIVGAGLVLELVGLDVLAVVAVLSGRPAQTSATRIPASLMRLAAHPPEAPGTHDDGVVLLRTGQLLHAHSFLLAMDCRGLYSRQRDREGDRDEQRRAQRALDCGYRFTDGPLRHFRAGRRVVLQSLADRRRRGCLRVPSIGGARASGGGSGGERRRLRNDEQWRIRRSSSSIATPSTRLRHLPSRSSPARAPSRCPSSSTACSPSNRPTRRSASSQALGAFEREAREAHGMPWKALTAAQATALLTKISAQPDSDATRQAFDGIKGAVAETYFSTETGYERLPARLERQHRVRAAFPGTIPPCLRNSHEHWHEGGEVARYVGRHGTSRVKKVVLVSSVPPLMLKTVDNPGGLPIDVFDGLRKASLADRSQLYLDIASGPFFGYNRPGAKPSQGAIQSFWRQGMEGGAKNTYDSIAAFSATDFRTDLAKIDKPTLVIHGDDDQIVPIDASGRASAMLIKGAKLIVYKGAPHGITDTHKDRLNQDLLDFLRE
jgi:non-heme chloroperoxidase